MFIHSIKIPSFLTFTHTNIYKRGYDACETTTFRFGTVNIIGS